MKKYMVFLLSIFMFAAMPLTAFASEGNAGAGTCNVTFFVTDESGGYPGSSFTAVMVDETGTITDSYTFSKAGSWGGSNIPKYTVTAPATYTVTFEGLENGYTIVNTLDYSSDISFTATSGGIADVYWSIIATDPTDESSVSTENTGSILLEQAGKRNVNDKEAEEVYQSFLNAVSYIADDEAWYNALLINYELFGESSYAELYEKYVEGGTKEEFLSMSLFDRFVWTETYLKYAWAVNTGDVSTYFGSEENFENHITSHVTNMIENAPDHETVRDAYLTLAKWQYDYVLANGYPYNFINGQTYLDEVGEVAETLSAEESAEQEQKELEEAAAELLEGMDDEDIRELTGDTENNSSGNMGIIIAVVTVILLVAAGVYAFLRKRKG